MSFWLLFVAHGRLAMFSCYLDPGGSEGGLQLRRMVLSSFDDDKFNRWTGEEYKVFVALLPGVLQSGKGMLEPSHTLVSCGRPRATHDWSVL
jgi:hypothetical protein